MTRPRLAWCLQCQAWLPHDWFEPLAAVCKIHEDDAVKAAQERGSLGGQVTKARRQGEPKT